MGDWFINSHGACRHETTCIPDNHNKHLLGGCDKEGAAAKRELTMQCFLFFSGEEKKFGINVLFLT